MYPPYQWFEAVDRARRLQGGALDQLGLGPQESPFQVVFERPGLRLRQYGMGAAGALPLLIVPAPIKRPYVWDLAPERSVVRRALERKLGVYMAEWTSPAARDSAPGLADYSGPMLDDCIAAIAEETGRRDVFLTGHSLGGVFAALHSAYRPEHVAALALIDVPLHFNKATGAFERFLTHEIPGAIEPAPGRQVPGSFLSMISAHAAPGTFCVRRYLDYVASSASWERFITHWRVERWTLDELPISGQLFDDVVQDLYRGNRFMRGEFAIGAVRLHPSQVTAPLFSIYQPGSPIIPSESVLAFHRAAGSTNKEIAPYFGDTGVALQHVGPLVGDSAHRDIWPRIFAWFERFSIKPENQLTATTRSPLP